MEVILLEKIGQLGNLGDQVKVKAGFGRNFLIPKGKALPATPENKARFEAERADFEERQQEIKELADDLAAKVDEVTVVIDRPAGSSEKLFGSVTNADIAEYFQNEGVDIHRKVVEIVQPIRTLGEHAVRLRLHPDVVPEIVVTVERSVR